MNKSRTRRCDFRSEDGQLLIMIVIFAVIVAALITVVVNASRLYLEQTSLYAAADGAVASAANQIDLASLVNDNSGRAVPLSERRAREAVIEYAREAELITKFHDFRIADVRVEGTTATVIFQARVPMPFVGMIAEKYRGGVQITVKSHAELPLNQ